MQDNVKDAEERVAGLPASVALYLGVMLLFMLGVLLAVQFTHRKHEVATLERLRGLDYAERMIAGEARMWAQSLGEESTKEAGPAASLDHQALLLVVGCAAGGDATATEMVAQQRLDHCEQEAIQALTASGHTVNESIMAARRQRAELQGYIASRWLHHTQ